LHLKPPRKRDSTVRQAKAKEGGGATRRGGGSTKESGQGDIKRGGPRGLSKRKGGEMGRKMKFSRSSLSYKMVS